MLTNINKADTTEQSAVYIYRRFSISSFFFFFQFKSKNWQIPELEFVLGI